MRIRPPSAALLPAAALLLSATVHADNPPPAAADPVVQRAEAFKEAAGMLEKAAATRTRGNKSLAEQLFSSAELIVGPDAVAEIAPLFREGAPPRVTTPLKVIPKDTPAQPASVGNSDEDEPEPPKKGSLTGQIKLEGKPSFDGLGVVTLEPASGKFHKRKPKQRVMEQRDRQFAPKVMVIPVGSTVTFPNFDSVYHNVFSRSDSAAFDLGIYKNGQARDMTFNKEGIIRLGCNLHANMSAAIVVVSEPHYAITDRNGRFTFKSLEPGKYRMRAWSEKSLGAVVQDVTIKPEANTTSVTVKADQIANIDKFGAVRGKAP